MRTLREHIYRRLRKCVSGTSKVFPSNGHGSPSPTSSPVVFKEHPFYPLLSFYGLIYLIGLFFFFFKKKENKSTRIDHLACLGLG